MPIQIVEGLPVIKKLEAERVYTIEKSRALTQDIRPLKILILNLMPKKEETELQLLRLLGNTPLQIDVDFMYTATHESVNTRMSYLQKYYVTLDEVRDQAFDGLIITGAPVEHLEYDEVDYYDELNEIMAWAQTHVYARIYVCWGAQYAINYYYGVEKIDLPAKLFGIFEYEKLVNNHPLLRGFDEIYRVPQSRHTRIDHDQLTDIAELEVLTAHQEFGPDLVATKDLRDLFVFGHLEYDRDTLRNEYVRDLERGDEILMPVNYFPNNDPNTDPIFNWKSHAYLLFNNWINETYQHTPYDLSEIKENH
ncbi:MAG: homoserine O-succinyltransferase [Clostridiaceae bacterium]|jgi:homoserine O-succinyltransferase|nr:homoserine O-succinyltransferase [Bacillota bacterium]NLN51460.1 homoserine O-succinyltransferase [Clostridiaceae bacterium]